MSEAYTPQELMVAVASREIRDGDLVFVGMRLPILAYAVARNAHAPSARGLFEVGLMRDQPAAGFLGTMGDPPNVAGALWSTRMSNAMALMAQGHVDLGFIGGAEVDRFGNLNTSYVGDRAKPTVKLPGSGGGADIAILSRRRSSPHLATATVRRAGASATACWAAAPRRSSRLFACCVLQSKAERRISTQFTPGTPWTRCARRRAGT